VKHHSIPGAVPSRVQQELRVAEGVIAIPDVRVILVGKTGLDAALRLDPGVELVRVESALEAIGELAIPHPESNVPSVVVISDKESQAQGEPVTAQLVEGLRTVEPSVRVLRAIAGDDVRSPQSSTLFDGTVRVKDSVERVRAAVRGETSPGAVGSPTAPALPVSPADADTGAQAANVGGAQPEGTFGDQALAAVMVRGLDVVPAAVELLRARLGEPGLEFTPGEVGAGCPVTWEGRVLGWIRGSKRVKAAHAEWLASWVRLRDQLVQLQDAAFTDPLTGAWNRRYFDKFLAAALSAARAARRNVTLLHFDLDNFKQYNDQYGHAAGDEILRETVKLLRSVTRPTDRVCRIGGDEFVVIFHEPEGPRQSTSRHPQSVFQIAARFQEQVRLRFPKLSSRAPGPLAVSGGLATFPWDGTTPEELLKRADELTLQSKRQGKNAILLGPADEVDENAPRE
jgi:two-component system, cell cycle response regulator